jgi:hypothetical protein
VVPNNLMPSTKNLLLQWLLAGFFVSGAIVQSAQPQEKPAPPATVDSVASQSGGAPAISHTVASGREALMLLRTWGINDIHVRYTASGEMLRFSYRVADANKAKILNEKKNEPSMIVLKTGSKLGIPETEKVGKLRQTSDPENGREYWMVFTNVGKLVQPGDRVDIVIGTFRAANLIVEPSGPRSRVQKQ